MLEITFPIFKSQVIAYLEPEFQEHFDDKEVWEGILVNISDKLKEKCHACP